VRARASRPPKAFLGDEDAGREAGIVPLDFHLARIIGCTVAELGDRMSALEWLHWSRFLAVEKQSAELAAAKGAR
jgi:hypothetical protein